MILQHSHPCVPCSAVRAVEVPTGETHGGGVLRHAGLAGMILLQQLLTLDQDLHGQVRGQRPKHVLQLAATADLLWPQDGALAQGTQGLGLGLAPGQQAGTAQQVATGQHLGAGEGLMAHRAVQLTHLLCCYSCCSCGCGCGCGHVCPCHIVPGEQGPLVCYLK